MIVPFPVKRPSLSQHEYESACAGMDVLVNASSHLRKRFTAEMPRAHAAADFDARAILISLAYRIADEAERKLRAARPEPSSRAATGAEKSQPDAKPASGVLE